jgi:hypothetical protein
VDAAAWLGACVALALLRALRHSRAGVAKLLSLLLRFLLRVRGARHTFMMKHCNF